MPDLNEEEYYDTDSSDNEENHSRLLSSVSQLDSSQRVKPAQRKEITSNVSEYTLTEKIPTKKCVISVNELASALGKSSKHRVITKKLKNVTSKARTLPKPLEKPVEERIKRSIGFLNVRKQLQRWGAVVARNALKDHIKFPLNDNSVQIQKSDEFLSQFQSKTPLEEEIAKVLKQENKAEVKDEEDKEFTLTLQEMLEKRREMAFLRAKLSYREAKAQRQSKIKSKKYHRILKREKLRQQLKEFELLQKTDPEAALKKLSELDKTRAQERASLRHRNTGQWAKNLTVRAKYDTESRKILAEQLKISKELTQKVQQLEDSDQEETEEQVHSQLLNGNSNFEDRSKFKDNPWNLSLSKEVEDFVSGYKKYWSEQNKTAGEDSTNKEENTEEDVPNTEDFEKNAEEPEQEVKKIDNPPTIDVKKPEKSKKKSEKLKEPKTKDSFKKDKSVSIYPGSGVWIVTPVRESDAKVQRKRKNVDIDTLFEELDEKLLADADIKVQKMKEQLQEKEEKRTKKTEEKEFDLSLKHKTTVERPDMDVGLLEGDENDSQKPKSNVDLVKDDAKSVTDIDPKNFIQVKPKKLRTQLPDDIIGEENKEKTQVMTIEEAFVDDDVIAEFKEMKEEEEKSKEMEIKTSLPGWGSWGGLGIVPKARKKSLMMVKVPPKKNKEKKDVIINENANPNLKKHLVKEVPHPFQSVEAFEANIRAPVGREWVPETAHWKLIQKQVETKLGAVIDPMDEEEIVRKEKTYKSPYKGKIQSKKKIT